MALLLLVAVPGTAAVHRLVASGPESSWSTGSTNTGTPGGNLPDPSAAPSTGPLDPSSIPAMVNPAVVNIDVTLNRGRAAGSGIVLTPNGEVLTNNHVIDGATSIKATDVGNGQVYQATVVGYDRSRDIAIIQLQNASKLATATVGDATKVRVGDAIVAIGNAGGKGGTPTSVTGTVTALNQTITASDEDGANSERLTGLIRVAADIQPGDSGGPLVDRSAHVIGVDTAATTGSSARTTGGDGFAIPINRALEIGREIEAGRGSATIHIGQTAFLGVLLSPTKSGSGSGVSITGVSPGSPAEQAGLAAGDSITAIDSSTVTSAADLTNALIKYHPGDKVTVSWVDDAGTSHHAPLKLASGPPS
jgi:S1-C subfamily serine protease